MNLIQCLPGILPYAGQVYIQIWFTELCLVLHFSPIISYFQPPVIHVIVNEISPYSSN